MDNAMLGRWRPGDILRDVQQRQVHVPLETVQARGAEFPLSNRENLVHSPGCSVCATVSNPRDLAIARTAGVPCVVSNDYTPVAGEDPWCAEMSLVPVLTSYQLHEHRAAGTSAVFIPAAWTTESQLVGLVERAFSLGLYPLVGVGCVAEVRAAHAAGARAIATDVVTAPQLQETVEELGLVTAIIGGVAQPREVLSNALDGVKTVCVPARLPDEDDVTAVQRLRTCVSMGTHPAVLFR